MMSLSHSLWYILVEKNAYVITSVIGSLESISNIPQRVIHSCKNDDDDEGDEARARQETRGYLSSVSAVSPRGPSLL